MSGIERLLCVIGFVVLVIFAINLFLMIRGGF
jgi:hypothetical protein